MKVCIDASISYTKGKVFIRRMGQTDVSSYAFRMGKTQEERNRIRKEMKEKVKRFKSDDTDVYFTVLYDGKYYGNIYTKALDREGTKANAFFYLPQIKETEDVDTQVLQTFIEMCKETRFYEDELGIVNMENGGLSSYVISIKNLIEADKVARA